ncbi:MAG: hypothetical protein KMY53_16085 [Desulfarculus sp.]|nr:hypothetical protein [Pseudomonadota bacterium]MBV1715465.1 hypothetical protein [Desulfarculus sp.]MBU4576229.1 hypothetical protein [Pseudomonadota bacterium]MBU4599267.1 hypothetical protein [Pseudomonadota bacterium]MBV1739688.1 hypothetical protein [Desulfarculus sp.]
MAPRPLINVGAPAPIKASFDLNELGGLDDQTLVNVWDTAGGLVRIRKLAEVAKADDEMTRELFERIVAKMHSRGLMPAEVPPGVPEPPQAASKSEDPVTAPFTVTGPPGSRSWAKAISTFYPASGNGYAFSGGFLDSPLRVANKSYALLACQPDGQASGPRCYVLVKVLNGAVLDWEHKIDGVPLFTFKGKNMVMVSVGFEGCKITSDGWAAMIKEFPIMEKWAYKGRPGGLAPIAHYLLRNGIGCTPDDWMA